MNSIAMNFDDNTDINAVYNQLKKLYPNGRIIKTDIDISELLEDKYLLALATEREKRETGKSYSEAEVMRELGITEKDIEEAEDLEIE